MKGKISVYGFLEIERVGDMKRQFCPMGRGEYSCGDWCPMFEEPYVSKIHGNTVVSICANRQLCFSDFEDERKK